MGRRRSHSGLRTSQGTADSFGGSKTGLNQIQQVGLGRISSKCKIEEMAAGRRLLRCLFEEGRPSKLPTPLLLSYASLVSPAMSISRSRVSSSERPRTASYLGAHPPFDQRSRNLPVIHSQCTSLVPPLPNFWWTHDILLTHSGHPTWSLQPDSAVELEIYHYAVRGKEYMDTCYRTKNSPVTRSAFHLVVLNYLVHRPISIVGCYATPHCGTSTNRDHPLSLRRSQSM